MEKNLVQRIAGFSQHILLDNNAVLPQDRHAFACDQRIRIRRADDNARDPAFDDGIGAGRLLAVVTAGLQRHIHGRSPHIFRRIRQRCALRMQLAIARVPALGENAPVTHDDCANHRIWRGPAPAAFGKLQCSTHIILIIHLFHLTKKALNVYRSGQCKNAMKKQNLECQTFQSHRTPDKIFPCVRLLPSRLYCRPRNFTESCAVALAGFTAGGDFHPALKIIYSLITFIIRLHPQCVKMVRDHFHIVSAMNNRYQGDTS